MPITNHINQDIAIIHDERSNELLAKAAIIKYDKARQILTVNSSYFTNNESIRVNMLISTEKSVIECQGVVRSYDGLGYREITVFNAKEKNRRSTVRYPIHADATIYNILLSGSTSLIDSSFPVTLSDISSSGALLTISSIDLNVGSTFQLKLKIEDSDVIINTNVVRIISSEGGVMQLGCNFTSIAD